MQVSSIIFFVRKWDILLRNHAWNDYNNHKHDTSTKLVLLNDKDDLKSTKDLTSYHIQVESKKNKQPLKIKRRVQNVTKEVK